MTNPDQVSDCVLVLAPIGRDATASADLMRRAGVPAETCADLDSLLAGIHAGAAAVCLTEEAIFGRDISRMTDWVERQPAWSDLPFIVLTSRQDRKDVVAWRQQIMMSLGNVTMIERPMQVITLVSAVQTAVRARLRQYEIRTLMQAQREAAEQLEGLVQARTRELEASNDALRRQMAERAQIEEALRQAQKMDAIGHLSGGIAHDFNNLLQGMAGSLDLIRRRPNNAERVRRWAESGLQAAERGARLTAQLLAFSRAQRVEAKPVVVAELVSGIRDLLTRTLGPMIRITFELDTEGLPVMSDRTQLEMAVLNLAINARDAMPDGGELRIATRRQRIARDPELPPGEYIELRVTDTGAGMTREVAQRAFNPFYTTKGIGKGTGLGLSQVYGIARQAGGTARIETAIGAGTTVRVLLRVTDIAPIMDDADQQPENTPACHAATVLVIDDDADVRSFMADALDSLGYRVEQAESGEAGLRAIDRAVPEVVVIDFAMPGLNGADVAKAARAKQPALPIVFASGYADTHAIEGVVGPNTHILRKPFRVNELQAAVAEALHNRQPAQGGFRASRQGAPIRSR